MKVLSILIIFALSAIAYGQFAAAARGLYQPVILSIGTVLTAMNSVSSDDGDSRSMKELLTDTFGHVLKIENVKEDSPGEEERINVADNIDLEKPELTEHDEI